MKKFLVTLGLFVTVGIFSAKAQETKVKPVTTPGDKVHNVIHPKHKKAHGVKYKHTSSWGKKHKRKVKTANSQAMRPKEKVE